MKGQCKPPNTGGSQREFQQLYIIQKHFGTTLPSLIPLPLEKAAWNVTVPKITCGSCGLLSWMLYFTQAITALNTCSSLRTFNSSLDMMSMSWLAGSSMNSSLSITWERQRKKGGREEGQSIRAIHHSSTWRTDSEKAKSPSVPIHVKGFLHRAEGSPQQHNKTLLDWHAFSTL